MNRRTFLQRTLGSALTAAGLWFGVRPEWGHQFSAEFRNYTATYQPDGVRVWTLWEPVPAGPVYMSRLCSPYDWDYDDG